jgi:hypothetical protein
MTSCQRVEREPERTAALFLWSKFGTSAVGVRSRHSDPAGWNGVTAATPNDILLLLRNNNPSSITTVYDFLALIVICLNDMYSRKYL